MCALRPYQEQAVEAIEDEWFSKGNARTLIVLATGTGKTICMSEISKREVMRGGRVLMLAHRGELLDQAADKFSRFAGLKVGIEMGEETCGLDYYPVVVGSVQSMCRPKRLAKYIPGAFSLVMIDEAHHSVSGTYQDVLDHFSGARVLGVTATPDRADKKGLAQTFDSIAYEYGIRDAVRDGFLVPIVAKQLPVEVDMTGVKTQAGDYAAQDVSNRLEPMLPAIARAMVDAGCKNRKSVAFLPLIDTAQKFKDACESVGLRAAEVNGQSQNRAEILADFEAGEFDVLCNAMLLTEGWDCPSVDCIVPLRATKSRALYAQMVGRGTRLCPETGKTHLLLLDFLWMTDRHDLCKPASLVAKDEKVAQKIKDYMDDMGEWDVLELEQKAQSDVIAERENALAEELKKQRSRKAKTVDPLQYFISIESEDIAGYEPIMQWEFNKPSEKQLKFIEDHGLDTQGVWCAGLASKLIDALMTRQSLHMATPRQIRTLEKYGFIHVGQWSFNDANAMIGHIASNGWRLPYGVDPSTYAGHDVRKYTQNTTQRNAHEDKPY